MRPFRQDILFFALFYLVYSFSAISPRYWVAAATTATVCSIQIESSKPICVCVLVSSLLLQSLFHVPTQKIALTSIDVCNCSPFDQ